MIGFASLSRERTRALVTTEPAWDYEREVRDRQREEFFADAGYASLFGRRTNWRDEL